jgi:hypothetical protein
VTSGHGESNHGDFFSSFSVIFVIAGDTAAALILFYYTLYDFSSPNQSGRLIVYCRRQEKIQEATT